MLEPRTVYDGPEAAAVAELLIRIGVDEKHWPEPEVVAMVTSGAQLIGVFEGGACVGGTQITYHRPFPCEASPFNFQIPEGRTSCEVTLIGVKREHRRSSPDGGAEVLDALVKGLYRFHLGNGGEYIYTLCEKWTFRVLTDGYVGIVGRMVTSGHHYWCGQPDCPGPRCQLTAVCELDMRSSERNWTANRPAFWAYLNA